MNYIQNYTIIDLETTGLNPFYDDIIELGALQIRDGQPAEKYSELVRPNKPISGKITELTGITNEMLADAPALEERLPLFMDFIGNDIIVGHNVDFDIRFMTNALNTHFTCEAIDTLRISRILYPQTSHHALKDMVEMLGLDDGEHHRALADCHHTYKLLNALINAAGENDTNIFVPQPVNMNPTVKSFRTEPSSVTKSINTLRGIVYGVLCDNILTEDEVLALNAWLNENQQLAGNYPFDVLYSEIGKVLEDNIIEKEELERLVEVLQNVSDPVNSQKESADSDIDFENKTVCLSGEFISGSKSEYSAKLVTKGATIKETITKQVDILIVGGNGSESWACGNYGTKVKKALEMQSKGHHIKIIREKDVRL